MPRALTRRSGLLATFACSACRLGFDDANLGGRDAATDALVIPPDARIVTVTFGERPGANHTNVTTDATLDEAMPDTAVGLDEDLSVAGVGGSRNRALLRFDVSALAVGTPVVAARIDVVRLDYGDEVAGALVLRTPGESWVEAQATWSEHAAGMTWATAGGDPAGMLGTVPAPATNAFSIALPTATVQAWIDAPATNLGVLLTGADESMQVHYHVHARQSTMLDARPLLVVAVAP